MDGCLIGFRWMLLSTGIHKKLEEEVGWQQKSEGKFKYHEGNECVMYYMCAVY